VAELPCPLVPVVPLVPVAPLELLLCFPPPILQVSETISILDTLMVFSPAPALPPLTAEPPPALSVP
jgi:hypothetical protein